MNSSNITRSFVRIVTRRESQTGMLLTHVLIPKQAPHRQPMMKTSNYQARKLLPSLVSGRSPRKLGRYGDGWYVDQAHSIATDLMNVESRSGCTMIERGGRRHQLSALFDRNQYHSESLESYTIDYEFFSWSASVQVVCTRICLSLTQLKDFSAFRMKQFVWTLRLLMGPQLPDSPTLYLSSICF